MLQALREKTSGWIAFFILAAVSIPFAFFGIESYFQVQTETYVAKIGAAEISEQGFRERFSEYTQQLRGALGENYSAEQFESATAKREFLERLIDEEVLAQAAQRAGTTASDRVLREAIAAIPAFQTEGRFDADQYRLLLSTRGLDLGDFERRMRRELSTSELPSQVAASAEVTPQAIERFIVLRDQVRDFRYVVVPLATPTVEEPTEDAIAAHYESNKDAFLSEEQVSLQYVELQAGTGEGLAQLDEASLRVRYEEQKARFSLGEQRLASHVLVRVEPNATAEVEKTALDAATAIATAARAGRDFAELARERSEDLGSKAAGGDLGWIEKGVTDPAFEAALFALEPGAISDPIKGADGYHVIQLRELQNAAVRSFEEVRQELADEYRRGEIERDFVDRSGKLIDQVYADPSSLEPAALALGLEVRRTEFFGRGGGAGIAANSMVVRAAFSDPVLIDGQASEAIELGPQHIVVVKVDEHRPRAPRPLDEVRSEVIARIKAEAVRKASDERAAAIAARLAEGATLDTLAAEVGGGARVESASGVGRTALNHDAAVVTEAFKLARPASADQPTHAMAELGDGRRVLLELTGVTDGSIDKVDAAAREAARQQLASAAQSDDGRAFVEALRAGFEIKIRDVPL
jgi:peptidyl-prolyl cis-trans isomerase D